MAWWVLRNLKAAETLNPPPCRTHVTMSPTSIAHTASSAAVAAYSAFHGAASRRCVPQTPSPVAESAFVLVAGGLGERLGYDGIKVALPVETTTNTSYLQHYASYVLALQRRSAAALAAAGRAPAATPAPFVIMTSGDTHERTLALLAAHNNFGLDAAQLHVLQQEKVAAVADVAGHLAMADATTVDTKPHGHGDVHAVLHRSGLPRAWLAQGKRHVVFLQDTNAIAFVCLLSALGVSAEKALEVCVCGERGRR